MPGHDAEGDSAPEEREDHDEESDAGVLPPSLVGDASFATCPLLEQSALDRPGIVRRCLIGRRVPPCGLGHAGSLGAFLHTLVQMRERLEALQAVTEAIGTAVQADAAVVRFLDEERAELVARTV